MNKVFLGGTCNGSTWRDEIIPQLKIDYFNPLVDDWNDEAQAEEDRQKEVCNYHLYVITPKMRGVYSIAEAVNSAWESSLSHWKRKKMTTIFCFIDNDGDDVFDENQLKSLMATANIIRKRGCPVFANLGDLVDYLNAQ